MRKPGFCICENKDADQLPGDREVDPGLPHVMEKLGKFKFFQGQGIVREICKLSGKLRNIVKCQGLLKI